MSPTRYLGGRKLGHRCPGFLEVVAEFGGEVLLEVARVAGLAVVQSP